MLGGLWSVPSNPSCFYLVPLRLTFSLYGDSVDTVLTSPRLLNLPLLLLANKQDTPTSLSPAEVRESFDAWHRARSESDMNDSLNLDPDANPDGENVSGDNIGGNTARPMRLSDVDGAKAERMASLDVLGVSALTGDGVKDAVTWLYARVRNARRM